MLVTSTAFNPEIAGHAEHFQGLCL